MKTENAIKINKIINKMEASLIRDREDEYEELDLECRFEEKLDIKNAEKFLEETKELNNLLFSVEKPNIDDSKEYISRLRKIDTSLTTFLKNTSTEKEIILLLNKCQYKIANTIIQGRTYLKELEAQPTHPVDFCIRMSKEINEFKKIIDTQTSLNKFARKNLQEVKELLEEIKFPKEEKNTPEYIIKNFSQIKLVFLAIFFKIECSKNKKEIIGKTGPLGFVKITPDCSKYFLELYKSSTKIAADIQSLAPLLESKIAKPS